MSILSLVFSYWIRLPLLVFCFTFSALSCAGSMGFITRPGGPHVYNVELRKSDIVNQVGATYSQDFKISGYYSGEISCVEHPIYVSPIFFSGRMIMPLSDKNPGYYKLNDYIDVKIEIFISGNLNRYVTVPFESVSNEFVEPTCTSPSQVYSQFESGSKGRVTFMVTRKIVNGVMIHNREVASMFGRLASFTSAMPTEPMVKVVIASSMLVVPDKCAVNDGRQMDIDFGENNGANINKKNINKLIPVSFKCEGGEFETGKLNIKLAVSADAASFNSNLVKTNMSSLGIQFSQGGKKLKPNVFYPVANVNNGGSWDLVATLVSKNNQYLAEGEFSASATIVASFQ